MKQVLYFSSPWCSPCRQFKPVMQELQSEMSITFIDVDVSPQSAASWNVRSVPTTLFIKNGVEVGRLVGAKSKDEIIALYNR